MNKQKISKRDKNYKNFNLNSGAENILTEMKCSLDSFNNRFEQIERRISRLEDRSVEIICS